ncbi:transporter substrate-binding domain-containing protein [Paludibacterium sp. THUN1379]|uniref:substrate-binding periplasmic protein n=1 Tax=Paludibacterium sp. THUN1379 TaxID=3112107 RepID=UPI0030CB1FA7
MARSAWCRMGLMALWGMLPWLALASTTVIHAVTEETPWAFVSNGKVAGTATEVVQRTLTRAGYRFQLSLYPWARSYEMALRQPDVLIYLIARTPARENQFKWVGEVVRFRPYLYKLKDTPPITLHSLSDAMSYNIGVVRDDVSQQYLQKKGFHRLIVSSSALNNFQLLLARQVQMMPLLPEEPAAYCARLKADCTRLEKVFALDELTTKLYMAYSQQTSDEVVNRTRQAFEALRAAGVVDHIMAPR